MRSRLSRAVMGGLGAALLTILWSLPAPLAHEERLIMGRAQVVDLRGQVLVVEEDPTGERAVRLIVDTDTEVRRCRHRLPLAALRAGTLVRVKYLDRPDRGPEALSILMLSTGAERGR